MQKFLKNKKRNSAFVMLFAVVVSGIILTIALGVTNIALKELSFDTGAKSTNDAFFAADAGVECALFYDLTGEGDVSAFGQPSAGLNTNCAGTDVDLNNGGSTPTTGPWTFYLYPLGSSGNACAIVNVTKTLNPNVTTIVSKGYNLGGNTYDCSSTNLNRVERELVVVVGDPTLPPVPNNFDLNVAIQGLGTVDSDPGHPGISCNPSCFASYLDGTVITLTATPSSGYTFSNWSGDCAAETTNQCNLTIDQDRTVTAIFTAVTHDLTVTLPNNGNITSSPGSIDCGSTANPDICVGSFAENSPVVLTATPDSGYTATWTGACSGFTYPATCNLTMDTDKTAGATFSLLSAFPVVVGSTFSTYNGATNLHPVSLPGVANPNDLILMFFTVHGTTVNIPAGWSQLANSVSGSNRIAIFYKIATGGETSVNVTTGAAEVSAHQTVRISGYTSTPQISAIQNGNSSAPNSQSLTPTWGLKKTLWFSVHSRNTGSNISTLSYPTNYTNGTTTAVLPADTNGATISSARRNLEVATENPGDPTPANQPFSISASDNWIGYTVAVQGI